MLKKTWEKAEAEIKSHTTIYILLAIVLFGALFVRVHRTQDLLRFYYDQGRDALVIWRFWHEARPFLIGPVTGLAGIFLGPFYYYLIAPFYLIGGGNPVYPAVFLAFLSVAAVFFVYLLGKKMHCRQTGVIAAIISSFSYFLILAGRWLANPTPILLTSILILWAMWEIINEVGKKDKGKWWVAIALLVGISLQLEAASAVFYLPMILVFVFWQRKNLPSQKTIFLSFLLFFLTLLPQVAFNFRHDNILFDNFKRVVIEEKSFRTDFMTVLDTRLNYFWEVFNSKLYPGWRIYASLFTIFSLIMLLLTKQIDKKKVIPLFSIYLGVPMIGFILFQGNYGNIYDYYMTGYYLPMILLFSIGLGVLWKKRQGKIPVLFFFVSFFILNGQLTKNYLIAGVDGPTHITLGNQLQAVDWVFEDAKGRGEFNVDVYVPPVIPHAYDYLFLWQGKKRCGKNLCGMLKDSRDLLYILYEVDPPHPERLDAWLDRQKEIGVVEEEASFGGITVQRRKRLKVF